MVNEVIQRLSGLDLKRIFLTGEEASIDPNSGTLTRAFYENFNSENILYTNGYQMPPLSN